MTDCDVIVIGGGIAGLAAAVVLSDAGLRVSVLEQSDTLGGRARSCTDGLTGDRVDIGPHILLSEYRNMLRLLARLGTREQVVWQQGEFITLVDRPHPVSVRMHRLPAPLHFLPSMLKLPQVSRRDLASNGRLLWFVARMDSHDAQRIDGIDAESFLRQMGVSRHFIDWFWRSAAMAIMNVPLERCSSAALLGFFRYMIGISGYQVGFAGIGLGDLFVPTAQAVVEAAGGQIRLEAQVDRLILQGDAVAGVALGDGSELRARHVIAAVPPQSLELLLPAGCDQGPLARLPEFAPSAYVSTYLWFDRKLTERRFWAKVWSPQTLHYDFYDLSNIRPGWQQRPSLIACNLIYSQRAEGLSDEQVIAAAVRELAALAPGVERAELRHARVHRIPMAIPAPHPGSEGLRPKPRTPIARFYLAGDWLDTGLPASMESAVRAAWMAAEEVLRDLGRPQTLVSPLPEVEGAVRLLGPAAL